MRKKILAIIATGLEGSRSRTNFTEHIAKASIIYRTGEVITLRSKAVEYGSASESNINETVMNLMVNNNIINKEKCGLNQYCSDNNIKLIHNDYDLGKESTLQKILKKWN